MRTKGDREQPIAQKHELKFVFHNSLAPKLLGWLEAFCPPDPHYPSGTVNSVYFDTPDGLFLEDKASSFYLKTKVRLRWYSELGGSTQTDAVFFEVKMKTGSQRNKLRVQLPLSGKRLSQLPLSSPEWLLVPELKGIDNWIPHEPLYPALKIIYHRKRYLESSTSSRLALDFNIRFAAAGNRIWPSTYSAFLREGVFEMKGATQELPPALYPLTDFGCRKQSFSKYGDAVSHLMRQR